MGGAAMATLAGGSLLGGETSRYNQNRDETKTSRDYQAKQEDTSMRAEATYRAKRQMLQGAIEDFYKQKGWPIPTPGEGAFTTRPLPGDKPLYEGYDVPKASWNYGKIQPDDIAPVPSPSTPSVPSPQPTQTMDISNAAPLVGNVPNASSQPIATPGINRPTNSMMALDPKIEETLRRYGY